MTIATVIGAETKKRKKPGRRVLFSDADYLRHALGGALPGNWSSDHRRETERYTDWNYIAIRAIERQVKQAATLVFDDAGPDGVERKHIRDFERVRWRENPVARMMGKTYWQGLPSGDLTKALYENPQEKTYPLPATHPLVRLLARPNPWQSGADFRAQRIQQLSLTGKCLIWNHKNKAGKTIERYVIPTAVAQPLEASNDLPMGGWRIDTSVVSRYTREFPGLMESRGLNKIFGYGIPAEHVQVTRFSHPLFPDAGYSPTSACSLLLDVMRQIIVSHWSLLNNRADPSVHIQLPDDFVGDESDVEAIISRAQAKYSGAANVGKIMATQGQATILTHSGREMDYSNTIDKYRDSVLAIHGTSAVAAGIQEPSGSQGYYAPLKAFIDLVVQPQLDQVAEEDTHCFAPEFGDSLTIEHEAHRVDDPEHVERQLSTDISSQSIKKNEYRATRGLGPLDGDEGEKLIGAPDPSMMGMGMGMGMPGMGGGLPGQKPKPKPEAEDDDKEDLDGNARFARQREEMDALIGNLTKADIAAVTSNGRY